MDVGSIVSNALGGLLGGLALFLLIEVGKQIHRKIQQKAATPKEELDKTLRDSQEYQQILQGRHSYLMIGYMCLAMLLALLGAMIAAWVQTRKISLGVEWIGFLLLLLCEVPLTLYLGYSPISSQEVERKRQQNREKTFKEARGARPYGYIFRYIVFPIIFWMYGFMCFVGFGLFIAFPSPFHIPPPWTVLGIGAVALIVIFFTYIWWTKIIYRAVRNLKYVPYLQQRELREQFLQDEFEQ